MFWAELTNTENDRMRARSVFILFEISDFKYTEKRQGFWGEGRGLTTVGRMFFTAGHYVNRGDAANAGFFQPQRTRRTRRASRGRGNENEFYYWAKASSFRASYPWLKRGAIEL